MTQYTAKKAYIKNADGDYIVPYVNPADDTNLGVVKVDNDTLASDNGTISLKSGNSMLHALKGYADKGELLTDAQGLADVKDYAHSTFDASKFTKVGSPIVTDDGVMTKTSSGQGYNIVSNFNSTQKYIVKTRYYFNSSISSGMEYMFEYREYGLIDIGINGGLIVDWHTPYGGSIVYSNTGLRPNVDDILDIEFENNGTNIIIRYYLNGELSFTRTLNSSDYSASGQNITIRNYFAWESSGKVRYDLKYTSVTVDGVPFFSGNKTGVDTVKADDYTNIDLTISDNGFITGSSAYPCYALTPTINLGDFSNWEIRFPVYFKNNNQYYVPIECYPNNSNSIRYYRTNDNKIQFAVGNGLNTWYKLETVSSPFALNTLYWLKLGFTGTQYYTSYSLSQNGVYTDIIRFDETQKVPNCQISLSYNNATGQSLCDWDYLNIFQVWGNGNLVYQPCLKIPYTESKTGSKVVDAVYRSRVNDMASQFGYAPYYTLSDTDFTLPQGEVYGLIEKVSNRPDYSSSITTTDISTSTNAYTIGAKSLAVIKPTTQNAAYTISVQPAYDTSYKSINGYGNMTLMFDTGDKLYTSAAATMDIYLIK